MTDKGRDIFKAATHDVWLSYNYIGGVTPDTDLASEDATIRKRGIKFLSDQAQGVSNRVVLFLVVCSAVLGVKDYLAERTGGALADHSVEARF